MRLSAGLAGAVAVLAAGAAQAQDPGPDAPVHYDVSFDNAAHHEARIVATFRGVPAGPLRVQMARSSPGRYAIHEFAKNVYSVSATDGAGRPLAITRTDPYGWSVGGHDGIVRVTYTLFGDHGDGTYAQIDTTHAHLNMPATFLWAPGYEDKPIRVRFVPRDPTWKIATQLPPASAANTYWAPNLQYFMDSPTEISDFMLREWKVAGANGKSYTIRLAVHHDGTAAEMDHFAQKVRRIIPQHRALFGAWPDFDFGTYTFIADYMPQITGDGMEHRNSTIITQPRGLAAADYDQIDTMSHEFVHAWNVERIRPRELEPFDFTRANPTPSLWLAEGFTQYYGPLLIRRAGEMSLDTFVTGLTQTLDHVVNSPARRYGSPQEMSLRAPFVDAAKSIDTGAPNIFVSYYPYGAIVALALDLSLRQRFPALTLDDFMRQLWTAHGSPERSYTPEDLRAALATVTKDARFAEAFFAASVSGSALPDFAPLLAQAGLTLRAKDATHGDLGATRAKLSGAEILLDQAPVPGSPLYAAGIDKGDRIVAIDGVPVTAVAQWQAALAGLKAGDRVDLRVAQRGGTREASVVAIPDAAIEVVGNEAIGAPVTSAQRAFRERWLGR